MALNKISKKVPFPHKTIGAFLGALKYYMNNFVYTFEFTITSSFQKAIQQIIQKKQDPDSITMGLETPLLLLTPMLLDPIPQTDFGWKSTNPYQVNWFQDKFIFQDGTIFNVGTRRMSGTVEYRVFVDSQMEAHDIGMAFLDTFRGLNKWIPLMGMRSCMILDDQIRLYKEDGIDTLDWSKTNMANKLFPGINSEKY